MITLRQLQGTNYRKNSFWLGTNLVILAQVHLFERPPLFTLPPGFPVGVMIAGQSRYRVTLFVATPSRHTTAGDTLAKGRRLQHLGSHTFL